MPFEVETVGACVRRFRIRVPPDELARAFDRELKELAKQVSMPGFRPGKVPRTVLERRFGDSVRAEVKDHLLSDTYQQAVKAHNLHPVETPPIHPPDVKTTPEGDVQVEFEVEVRPQFELLTYKEMKVAAPPVAVSDAEVEDGILKLRRNLAHVHEIESGPIEANDFLLADLTYTLLDGSVLQHPQRVLNLGAGLLETIKIENLAQSFFGKMKGDVVRVSATLPEHFEPKEHAGRTAAIDVAIAKIQRVEVPEVTPELLASMRVESLDELRAKMRESIQQSKEEDRNRSIEEQCLDLLVERHDFELPARLLERVEQEQMEHFRRQLRSVETPEEEVSRRALEFEGRNRELARKRVKARFLLDRIAEEENLQVSQEELQRALQHIAQMAGEQAAEVLEHYKDRDHLGSLALDVRRGKVRSLLRMSAEVVELEGRPSQASSKEASAS